MTPETPQTPQRNVTAASEVKRCGEFNRLILHSVIKGKQRCDRCERKGVGAISECQIPIYSKNPRPSHWIDLCEACQTLLDARFADCLSIEPDAWREALCVNSSEEER